MNGFNSVEWLRNFEEWLFMNLFLKKLGFILTSVTCILLFISLAFIQYRASLRANFSARIVLWLAIVQSGLVIGFFLVRRFSSAGTWNPWHIFIAYLGFFSPLFFRAENHPHFRLIGLALQFSGILLTFYGSLSLGRSWGILPANRGIKTQGMYRYVRHPIYASYQISTLGVLISNLSLYNLEVVCLFTLSQIMRLNIEEKILSADPVYLEYTSKVK